MLVLGALSTCCRLPSEARKAQLQDKSPKPLIDECIRGVASLLSPRVSWPKLHVYTQPIFADEL